MCFLFPTTFKKLSYPLNFLGLVYILQYNVLINFSSLGMEVLITMNSWKTPAVDSIRSFRRTVPYICFWKYYFFILHHCSASLQKGSFLCGTNISFLIGPDASSTHNKICVFLLFDNWRNSTWYWNFRIVSVVEYSRLPITRTLANSNQNLFPVDHCNFTLGNSNPRLLELSLTRTNFRFPSGHFWYNFTLDNSNDVLSP